MIFCYLSSIPYSDYFHIIFGLKTLLKPVIKKLYMTSATGEVVDVWWWRIAPMGEERPNYG